MSSDGDCDCAIDINISVQVIPYMYDSTTLSLSHTKLKLVATASSVKPGLIYWPKPSESRRNKQMLGIKNLKNNMNVNVFITGLFW